MDRTTAGWLSGLIGVIIFSGSLPATRVADADFSPLFVTAVRGAFAAALGAACVLTTRQVVPSGHDLGSLLLVALGVVIGFPLLTALALQHITAAHSLVYIGLLPVATAAFGVLRGRERPAPAFWLFSVAGAAIVVAYAVSHRDDSEQIGDALMISAVVVCGLGYAEGATLSRRLGGWQVISWALILACPVTVALVVLSAPSTLAGVGNASWLSLAYLSIFSMFVGFVFWYRGLALGGIAGVSQLQLLQPFIGLALAGLLLHEQLAPTMFAAAGAVVLCVAGAKRFAPGAAVRARIEA